MNTITEAEILEALAVASNGPEDARTVQEMVTETGVPVGRLRKALKAMQAAGRLRAHTVRRPDLSGRVQCVPAYTILPKAPAKRKR